MPLPEDVDGDLDSIARQIDVQARNAYLELLALLSAGTALDEALATIRESFEPRYYQALSDAFDRVAADPWGVKELRAYPVGEVTLSGTLYRNWRETSSVVRQVLSRHTQGLQQARALALEIYTGYGLRRGEPLVLRGRQLRELPRALQELVRAPGIREVLLAAAARARATTLRTAALRSAYEQTVDASLAGAGEARLRNMLEVAVHEKMRYYANRIAQTELARVHADRVAQELMDDDTIDVVQIRLSGAHPREDICDVFARVNRFGLGPGCYPKALAPKPPFHPFCRCRMRSRPDLSAADAQDNADAERMFLRTMPAPQAARLVGSRQRLQEVLRGRPALDAWNRGTEKVHQVRTLGALPLDPVKLARIDAIERARAGENVPDIVLGLADASAAEILRLTGRDVRGWPRVLTASEARHVFHKHGNDKTERQRGQRGITSDDLAKAGLVAERGTATLSAEVHRGSKVIEYRLKLLNGDTVFVTEAVLRNKLALVTMFVRRARRGL